MAPEHKRRPRYSGRNPRAFHDRYKELDPARYPSDVERVLASGKTPAGTHRPIMVSEVLDCLRPSPGELAVDCTLGGGGHARAILKRVQPAGRLIGLDVDPIELPRTEAALRSEGFGPEAFAAHRLNFGGLPKVLATEARADMILADLGVSSMQLDNPDRGFNYKEPGPLDMRMNPSRGQSASELITRLSEEELTSLLDENADEPHAELIARLLKRQPLETTHALERAVRIGLTSAHGDLANTDVKMSVRRTFQALRIAVNNELSSLDALLRSLPSCLAPRGRVVILTFHSGEDRRVKKAFQAGYREGLYSAVATEVIRSTMEETRANRRASSAKLRWAVRATA
ncbi:MAG: 16S rRNA (cytosine(1402)-N(4))-methyltransferase RsmH [Acidobacteria bacterium]|nr:16S rRNA (cytosine(1402)-N(4))-methyltransferase RsmH [Acidobacteriota bacterium]